MLNLNVSKLANILAVGSLLLGADPSPIMKEQNSVVSEEVQVTGSASKAKKDNIVANGKAANLSSSKKVCDLTIEDLKSLAPSFYFVIIPIIRRREKENAHGNKVIPQV